MRILFFDDHPVVLDTLTSYFQQKEGVTIVGAATNKQALLDLIDKHEIDILISDVLTDDEIGLSLFEELQERGLGLKIVVFSSITSDFVKQFLYEYGVVAFLNKKQSLDELWETLKLVYQNTQFQAANIELEPPRLTKKEHEIARYLAKGLAAKEIAMITKNSVNTINNQKNNLLAKFHCTNSTELTLRLLQMGYLRI